MSVKRKRLDNRPRGKERPGGHEPAPLDTQLSAADSHGFGFLRPRLMRTKSKMKKMQNQKKKAFLDEYGVDWGFEN